MDYKSIIVQHNYTVEVQKPMLNITLSGQLTITILQRRARNSATAAAVTYVDRFSLIEFLNNDGGGVSTGTQCSAGLYRYLGIQ